ncbi:MAG: hypothetical protein U9R08_06830 [Nanoarchaeota archaeon]|nr:hypothetical protein [Nanoarchaeota archaeon]
MFLLKCPKCKNQMKYATRDSFLTKKVKKCVYCNKSFSVKDNILEKL